jgi:hypothetical protein
MTSQQSNANVSGSNTANKRGSDGSRDIGWKYGEIANRAISLDRLRCNFCQKVVGSGVNRLKKHIAGVSFIHVKLFRV